MYFNNNKKPQQKLSIDIEDKGGSNLPLPQNELENKTKKKTLATAPVCVGFLGPNSSHKCTQLQSHKREYFENGNILKTQNQRF